MNALIERMPRLPSDEVRTRLAIPPAAGNRMFLSPRCDLPRIAPPPVRPGARACRIGCALWDEKLEVCLHPSDISVHMAVLGESGTGKSKFQELHLRRTMLDRSPDGRLRESILRIDPDKQSADETLAFIAHRYRIGDVELIKHCHVLTLQEDLAFRFDPFALLPARSAVGRVVYYSRLDALVERLIRQLHRRVTSELLEVMTRLKPRMKAVLTASGVDLDGRGRHHGMAHASALANPLNPNFHGLLSQAFPHLPEDVQVTYREVMADKVRPADLDKWESTQNRLASAINPLMKLCLGAGPSLDFPRGIANREAYIVRIGQNRSVSSDTANKMAGLLLDAYIQVKEGEEDAPPDQLTPATVSLDEAGDFIAEDLCTALRKDRKLGLKFVLGAQNYMTLCNNDLAMGDYVLSQCGTVVCFAQRSARAGRDVVADRMFTGNLSFTRRMVEVQMQRGWLETRTFDASVSGNTTSTWSQTAGWGLSETESKQKSRQRGTVKSRAFTKGEGETDTHTDGRGSGVTSNGSQSLTNSPIIVNGIVVNSTPVISLAQGGGSSEQESHSDSFGRTRNKSTTTGSADTDVHGSSTGHAFSLSCSGTSGEGGSTGEGWTLSMKTGLMPNVVSEWRWDGGYEEGSAADQREIHQKWLHSLKTGECFVSVLGYPQAFPVKIDRVEEKWETPRLKQEAIRFIIGEIIKQHAYIIRPCEEPDDPVVVEAPVQRPQPAPADGFND